MEETARQKQGRSGVGDIIKMTWGVKNVNKN